MHRHPFLLGSPAPEKGPQQDRCIRLSYLQLTTNKHFFSIKVDTHRNILRDVLRK